LEDDMENDIKNIGEKVEYIRLAFQYQVIRIRESDNGN